MNNQHPLFVKYTREWLHQVSGYSKGFLSRVATGRTPLTRSFIERVCYKLGLPEEELFSTGAQPAQCLGPWGCATSGIGQWLEERCEREHLSLRKAGAKTGLSGATIGEIINGVRPLPETIKKLAQGFSGNGDQRLALEDYLLTLAGHRSKHPEGEEPSYLKVIPLLSPEYQHLVEALVMELAKIEGIEVSAG